MSATRRLDDDRIDLYPSRCGRVLDWTARKSPVVYPPHPSSYPLSDEQRAGFEREGFLVIHDLFTADELELLQAELQAMRSRPDGVARETLIAEPGNDRALRSVFAIHKQNALFGRLAADSRLVGIARNLLGDDVYIHQSRLNYKPGFDGKEFYWHSDFETWHVEDGMPEMRALSASLLLSENTPHNGPLMLLPGSHKYFVPCAGQTPENHYRKSLRKQEYGVPDRESLARLADAGGIAAPLGPAGTLIVFDCNIVHGSNGNITPDPRANAFIVYNAVSNRLTEPFGAATPRPAFIAERGAAVPLSPIQGPVRRG